MCVQLSTAWLQMWKVLGLEEPGGTTVVPGDPAV